MTYNINYTTDLIVGTDLDSDGQNDDYNFGGGIIAYNLHSWSGQSPNLLAALGAWEKVTNVDFIYNPFPGSNYTGWVMMLGDLPTNTYGATLASNQNYTGGILVVDEDQLAPSLAYGLGFETILHELGHTFGSGFFGPNHPTNPSTQTVMTSEDAAPYVLTPSILDIQAAQAAFGTKSYNTGDNTYSLDGETIAGGSDTWHADSGQTIVTIWDSGGTDTISLAGYNGSSGGKVDLRVGLNGSTEQYSEIGNTRLYVAFNVEMEKAIGSNNNDTLIGSDENNTLVGGLGNDTLEGNGGRDYYEFDANSGSDVINDNGVNDRILIANAKIEGTAKREGTSGPYSLQTGSGNYEVIKNGNVLTINGNGGTLTLNNWAEGDYGITTEEKPEPEEQTMNPLPASPLMLDLDGNGFGYYDFISLQASHVYFDLDNDGFAEKTGWTTGVDYFLVWDENNNGKIDGISELFGNNTVSGSNMNGFISLKNRVDSNNDNVIDSNDTNFSNLKLWKDTNANGNTDAGELTTITSHNITSIGLTYTNTHIEKAGGAVKQTGTFIQNGVSKSIVDMWFHQNQADSSYIIQPGFEYSDEALVAPNLRSLGILEPLQVKISEDSTLSQMVGDVLDTNIDNLFDAANYAGFRNEVRDILYRWTGADQVSSNQYGTYPYNSQDIHILRVIFDNPVFNPIVSTNPIVIGSIGPSVMNNLELIIDQYVAKFVAYAAVDEVYKNIYNGVISGGATGNTDWLNSVALTASNSLVGTPLEWMQELKYNPSLDNFYGDFYDFQTDFLQHFQSSGLFLEKGLNFLFAASRNYNEVIRAGYQQTTNGTTGDDYIEGHIPATFYDQEWSVTAPQGADTINGGDGNDTIAAGYGSDSVNGGNGDDLIFQLESSVYAFEPIDKDTLNGGAGDDTIYGGEDTDTIDGGDGNDFLSGGKHSDSVSGGLGNDTIVGTEYYSDTLNGGDGLDTVTYEADLYGLTINLTTQIATLYSNTESIIGFEAVIGTKENDTIIGASGSETLIGGVGADSLEGGAGTDYFKYRTISESVSTNSKYDTITDFVVGTDKIDVTGLGFTGIGTSAGQVTITQSGGYTYIDGVSNDFYIRLAGTLSLTASDFVGFGTSGGQVINGTSGNDTLTGGSGNDTISGAAGNDSISGNDGNDSLSGGSGADTINGGTGIDVLTYAASAAAVTVNLGNGYTAGADAAGDVITNVENLIGSAYADNLRGDSLGNRLEGGSGNDTLVGGTDDANTTVEGADTGNDTIYGGAGNDFVEGKDGSDWVYGEDGDDSVLGGTGNDSVYGGAGSDYISGQDGNDHLYGMAGGNGSNNTGNDTIYGGNGDDVVTGSGGFDYVNGEGGNDYVDGKDGNDTVYGGAGADSVYGGIGNDTVYAGADNDYVSGQGDDDVIAGEGGIDTITGGTGNDTFQYIVSLVDTNEANVDVITDAFTGTDVFDFTDLSNATLRGTGTAFVKASGTASQTLSANAGIFVMTNAVASFSEADVYTALSGIADDLLAGDKIYVAFSNGTDARLALITEAANAGSLTAADDTLQFVARLTGVTNAELAALSAANFADFV